MLGLDPGPGYNNVDWHQAQRHLIDEALHYYDAPGLATLAKIAVQQAALTCLSRPEVDLAQFAEQASLRYMGQLYGYAFHDHGLLEEASRATYRALQYLAVGQHFVTEPGTLPAAQQTLGRLVGRTGELMEAYTRLGRSPRLYGRESHKTWPDAVQPWSELGLESALGEPLLKRLPELGAQSPANQLSGRDRATVAATLLAGTLGNVQTAVCLLVQSLLADGQARREAELAKCDVALWHELERRMALQPPVPVLPRRSRVSVGKIPADADCLLLLEALPNCPHVWGAVAGRPSAPHACMGGPLAQPLILQLVRHTLGLRGLRPALDKLTGEALEVERLWGFAATRYLLHYDRERVRVQQNLIVSMRVKAPVAENAAHLRRLIMQAVPRIEHALNGFGHLHFAWFEFSDDETQLVLRTIYDGQFEAYVQYFAQRAGDLFDGLFEYLEDAPLRPVSEHPHEFVETIRRFNRVPLAGYLYSAYPAKGADSIRKS